MKLLQITATLLAIPAALVSATVPNSKRFDLTAPSHDLFRHKRLHNGPVQQGFAFDNTNARLFVAQRRDGAAENAGNLCITQLDFKCNKLGHMYLKGNGKYIAVFDLAAATKGDFSQPRANFQQPLVQPQTKAKNFPGYAAYGRYLYLLWSDSYEQSPTLNSQVAVVDMGTGQVVQGPVMTSAGKTLTFLEPEGMAVYRTASGQVRLFLSGKAGDRRANLFYKNVLV